MTSVPITELFRQGVVLLRRLGPRRRTGILLVPVAGLLLWANLRATDWEAVLRVQAPDDVDAVTHALFYRGWPLSPCLVCAWHGGRWHPEDGACQFALLLDAGVAMLVLAGVRFASERWLWPSRAVGR